MLSNDLIGSQKDTCIKGIGSPLLSSVDAKIKQRKTNDQT